TSRYDTGRVELNTGVARVPDARVDRLSALFKPKKTTYATFDVVDLAGIAKGERAGLDTKEFRNADALLHVARAFADPALDAPAPRRDIEDLETELILADLEVVERRLERLEAALKKRRPDVEARGAEGVARLKNARAGAAEDRAGGRDAAPRPDASGRRRQGDSWLHVPVPEADPPLRQPRREIPYRGRPRRGDLRPGCDRRPASHADRLGLSGDRDGG